MLTNPKIEYAILINIWENIMSKLRAGYSPKDVDMICGDFVMIAYFVSTETKFKLIKELFNSGVLLGALQRYRNTEYELNLAYVLLALEPEYNKFLIQYKEQLINLGVPTQMEMDDFARNAYSEILETVLEYVNNPLNNTSTTSVVDNFLDYMGIPTQRKEEEN